MKLIAQSASADGTSGIPKVCIARKSGGRTRARAARAVGEQDEVDGERADEVADDEPDRAPVEDGDEEDHRGDRDQTFAMLAIAYATERSSTRKSAVSCW
jgi:hypothetical protein